MNTSIYIQTFKDGRVAEEAERLLCEAMAARGHPFDFREMSFIAKSEDGSPLGYLHAELFYGKLYISRLVVLPEARGRGIGSELLQAAETEAKSRGAVSAYLGTWEIQAPDFYEGHGYTHLAKLEASPGHPAKFFMIKDLSLQKLSCLSHFECRTRM